jgi:hypothetical protein
MAEGESKDLLTRLADAGEDAIHRLSVPGADRLAGVATSARGRMDEMQRRLRGLDAMEARLAALEKRVNALEGKKPAAPRRKTSTRKSTSASSTARASSSKGSAAKKTSGSETGT